MPHIHIEPGHHDLTTSAFIVRMHEGKAYGLMHKHRKLGVLLPVGGHVELDETPWAGSIHEIAEESGYEIDQLKVLQPAERIRVMDGVKTHPVPLFLQTHEFKQGDEHYHVDVGFAFVTDELPRKSPEEGESTDILWLTLDELKQREAETHKDIVQIFEFVLTTALENWERVDPASFDV